jgi:hypothetical protein
LYAWLLKLIDGRKRRGIRYPLALILLLVILAKLGGEDGPKGMAEWLKHRMDFLVTHLKLRRASVPHPVTISRVLGQAVDVEAFENLMGAFSAAFREPGRASW